MTLTQQDIDTKIATLSSLIALADAADEKYRVERGKKFLEIACPTDPAKKKPSDPVIASMIDSDATLSALRIDRDAKQADVTAFKYSLDMYMHFAK